MPADTNAGRKDTIRQAVSLIDASSPEDLARWLHQTTIRNLGDPSRLRAALADGQHLTPAWTAARQLLAAAGQPATPEGTGTAPPADTPAA
jgi:hypothetical protein